MKSEAKKTFKGAERQVNVLKEKCNGLVNIRLVLVSCY